MTAVVSSNDISDDQVFGQLLDGVESEIAQVSGDGAYDRRKCYDSASHRGAKPTIPPRKNAVIWHHGNCKDTPHPRDENLREIRRVGRKKRVLNSPSHGECKKHSRQWKCESGSTDVLYQKQPCLGRK